MPVPCTVAAVAAAAAGPPEGRRPAVLTLVPSRELAQQIAREFEAWRLDLDYTTAAAGRAPPRGGGAPFLFQPSAYARSGGARPPGMFGGQEAEATQAAAQSDVLVPTGRGGV